MIDLESKDYSEDAINKLTVSWLRTQLTEEEWDILYLRKVKELNWDEIGIIVALKHRGKERLSGSAIRYHWKKLQKKLQKIKKYI